MPSPDLRFLFSRPAHFFALGLGTGLSPKAPGTLGTLLGFPVHWLLTLLPAAGFWLALAVLFVVGVWICDVTGKALGVPDHGSIVWDEIAAFALVLAFTPAMPVWFVAAFALFRLFDIWKPPPARQAEALPGGLGIMADDVVAGLYGALVLFAVGWFNL